MDYLNGKMNGGKVEPLDGIGRLFMNPALKTNRRIVGEGAKLVALGNGASGLKHPDDEVDGLALVG